MVTIKDIATATGVSPTTVSNVINGKAGRVSSDMQKKINAAIKELGYVPNMSAKSLVSKSSKVIGFVNHVLTIRGSNFMEDPFLSRFIGILEYVLRENGYFLMLRTVETPEELDAFLRAWNLDGLFLSGIFQDDFFKAITKRAENLPIVLIDSYVHQNHICNIGLDDFGGSKMSTQYLINKGHRNIAFASFHIEGEGVLSQRFLGYKAALAENNLPFDESLIFECGNDLTTTQHVAQALKSRPEVTGLVTAADFIAGNIISNFHKFGIRVPDDISVMGFDDLNICDIIFPSLSTIHQDVDKKGRIAVDYMLKLLEHEMPAPNEVFLPTSIIERDSVKSLI